jgi:hypothetical protein
LGLFVSKRISIAIKSALLGAHPVQDHKSNLGPTTKEKESRMGELTGKEFWTVFHGMILGAIYLLAFSGGLNGLFMLKRKYETPEGVSKALHQLKRGTASMAMICWAAVISGTYFVYPWYRDKSPQSPRSLLLADPAKAIWHNFGMEWKEHIAWASPILATVVAVLVFYYDEELVDHPEMRRALLFLFVLAFGAAAVAGLYGAFLNKVAPVV